MPPPQKGPLQLPVLSTSRFTVMTPLERRRSRTRSGRRPRRRPPSPKRRSERAASRSSCRSTKTVCRSERPWPRGRRPCPEPTKREPPPSTPPMLTQYLVECPGRVRAGLRAPREALPASARPPPRGEELRRMRRAGAARPEGPPLRRRPRGTVPRPTGRGSGPRTANRSRPGERPKTERANSVSPYSPGRPGRGARNRTALCPSRTRACRECEAPGRPCRPRKDEQKVR